MLEFVVITMGPLEEVNGGQINIRKMSQSLKGETVFTDYFKAKDFANRFKFTHVILKGDFQHWVTSGQLVAYTAKAYHEGTKYLTNVVI